MQFSVTSMSSMFSQCSGLKSLDVTNFNTANVTSMGSMFSYCSGLKSLDVTNFNTSNVTYMRNMFSFCSGLTSLDVSNFNTSKVKDMAGMFWTCSGLTSLDLSNFNTANVTDMQFMFEGCLNLKNLYVKNFNTSKVTNMSRMFEGCYLTSIDVSNFNTNNVTNMSYMFNSCHLTSLDVSNFNTNNVTNMEFMFQGTSVTTLDLSNFNTSKVTNMEYMFAYSYSLTTIYCNDVWTSINSTDMFKDCASLKGAINFDSSKTDITYANPTTGYFTKKSDKTDDLKDGDTFTAKTIEGVEMTFKVLSASDKTCQVGTGQGISIDKEYSGSITIPETINGFRVTTVAFEAFGSSKINSVVIGNNVTSINQNAFSNCQRLKSVTFPNNNGFGLGLWPFQGCTSLETITLPKNLISMDSNPFMGCSSLSYIGVDENNSNYKSVDGVIYSKDTKAIYAYPCDRQSTNYEIIGGTQVIRRGAFMSASKLEKIHIPNSVSQIYAQAFWECTNLNALILPPDITYIPQNMATFSGIKEVVIPNKVTSIESSAFSVCFNLTSVKVEIEEPLAIDENTFSNRTNATLYVPKGCVDAYSKANYWKEFKEIKEMDDGDADAEFKDGDTFTAKTVEGVEMTFKVISASDKTCQLGDGTKVCIDTSTSGRFTIPAEVNGFRVNSVASWALYGCYELNEIVISEGVESLMDNSIEQCNGVTSFVLPASVTSLSNTFGGVSSYMKSIKVAEGNPVYDSRNNCNAIIETATNVLRDGCVNTVIPSTVTAIGDWAMSNKNLTSISIPNNVKSIGEGALRYNRFKTVIIPESIEKVSSSAFEECRYLEKVTIASKKCRLEGAAFANCGMLKTVVSYIESPEAVYRNIFNNSYDGATREFILNDNVELYVPFGKKTIYENTNGWKNFKNIVELNATVGDVTGDGEVTKEDITEVETEILEPSEDFDPNKDVNRDGVVNVADIVKSNNIRNSQRQVR